MENKAEISTVYFYRLFVTILIVNIFLTYKIDIEYLNIINVIFLFISFAWYFYIFHSQEKSSYKLEVSSFIAIIFLGSNYYLTTNLIEGTITLQILSVLSAFLCVNTCLDLFFSI